MKWRHKMAKVSVHLGFTFRVGALDTNQYSRIDVDVRDIDTDLSVTDQLTETGKALENVWDVVRKTVDEKIESVLDSGGA
tara:strand:+ start:483 stop:722 length:240 start_codon:yes stop_codon:yes gene_type:complete